MLSAVPAPVSMCQTRFRCVKRAFDVSTMLHEGCNVGLIGDDEADGEIVTLLEQALAPCEPLAPPRCGPCRDHEILLSLVLEPR